MATLFTFRIISPEEDSFVMEIEADSKMSFYQIHLTIQKELKYDTGHPASFYLTNLNWEKEKEITLINHNEIGGKSFLDMKKAILENHLDAQNKRMLYVYDFFFERAFNVELIKVSTVDSQKTKGFPKCIRREGATPAQILMPEFIPGDDNLNDFFESDPDGPEFESLDDLDL